MFPFAMSASGEKGKTKPVMEIKKSQIWDCGNNLIPKSLFEYWLLTLVISNHWIYRLIQSTLHEGIGGDKNCPAPQAFLFVVFS